MTLTSQILANVPGNPLEGLRRADRLWESVKQRSLSVPQVVDTSDTRLGETEWDAIVCGGTLGILIGLALVRQGWRVLLVERGVLRGRDQEWNISRKELEVFLELELLTEGELERAIATTYNPARVSFLEGPEIWVRDILNIGVDPVFLLETLKQKFLAAGGKLLENTAFEGAVVHPDGVCVQAGDKLTARLLLDGMGHFSPIVRQVRQGRKPDAICMVVGSCATGFDRNETGDLMVSFTPIQNQCQYFWEAFPARDGRTTYLFTYLDAHRDRFSLEFFFDEYLRLLPEYQDVNLAQLQLQRALFGFFPSYRQSPLRSPWNRILPIGDSSSSQSPLSFGGFGAMLRHLSRLSGGIDEALRGDTLDRKSLALLQPYQPNLSVTWLFQQTMSVGVGQKVSPNAINELLGAVFAAMSELGDPVLRPFLQDVIQFGTLSQALFKTAINSPLVVTKIIPQVGLPSLLDWMRHYWALGAYRGLSAVGERLENWQGGSPQQQYYIRRWLEAWQYGSGGDYSR
ncbi:MAG TPA: FAD-binding oxidoreductase [Oscillatoriales cyanobacterium M59_W2019_021]|nr:MAG: FAD-binding oxidoreductase [Cyanobacteria bacterium J055]HIK32348.1 FAD-binding oxidoreductase [Oscillatoriales cyanobacterium M4454_W2019_049]HIK52942.1 FAD-binding oxidoreductase [Oscillatoriales cyanobacterium M59_W2019_021]